MHDLSVCLHNTSLQSFAYQPQRLVVDREGFKELLTKITLGQVGIIMVFYVYA